MGQIMNDAEVMVYLQSHAPLERFYLFVPKERSEVLMKYFDAAGKFWNIMEDDDETVAKASELLKRSGVRVFVDYPALLAYEEEEWARRFT
jgi:hypothetical protein